MLLLLCIYFKRKKQRGLQAIQLFQTNKVLSVSLCLHNWIGYQGLNGWATSGETFIFAASLMSVT